MPLPHLRGECGGVNCVSVVHSDIWSIACWGQRVGAYHRGVRASAVPVQGVCRPHCAWIRESWAENFRNFACSC